MNNQANARPQGARKRGRPPAPKLPPGKYGPLFAGGKRVEISGNPGPEQLTLANGQTLQTNTGTERTYAAPADQQEGFEQQPVTDDGFEPDEEAGPGPGSVADAAKAKQKVCSAHSFGCTTCEQQPIMRSCPCGVAGVRCAVMHACL